MRRFVLVACFGLLSAIGVHSQSTPFKFYSTHEEYCRDNPQAPTCRKADTSKLLNPEKPVINGSSQPGSRSSSVGGTSHRAHGSGPSVIEVPSSTPTPAQIAAVKTLGLRPDWRFADPQADLLVGINMAGLRHSTTLRALLIQLAPALKLTAGDIDSQLQQMADVDQLWISARSGEAVVLVQGPRAIVPAGPVDLKNGKVGYGICHGAVLIGEPTAAAAAVRRLRSVSATTSAAALQMKKQGTESELWALGKPTTLQNKVQSAAFSQGLSQYVLSVSLREGIQVALTLNYSTAAASRRAFTELEKKAPSPDWPVRVSSEVIDTALRIKVTAEEKALSQALQKAVATPAAQPLLEALGKSLQNSNQTVVYGAGGPVAIQPTPQTQPSPGKLLVCGLPGGCKEM